MSSQISNQRPAPDKVLSDIADYALEYEVRSDLAYATARACLTYPRSSDPTKTARPGGTPSAGLTRLGPKARASGYATWTPYPSLGEHALLMRSSEIAD